MSKCSVNCVSFGINSEYLTCTGPCRITYHDACTGITTRHWRTSEALTKYLRDNFICEDCKSFLTRATVKLEQIGNELNEKFKIFDSILKNMELKINNSYQALSDTVDDLNLDLTEVKDQLRTLPDKINKKKDSDLSYIIGQIELLCKKPQPNNDDDLHMSIYDEIKNSRINNEQDKIAELLEKNNENFVKRFDKIENLLIHNNEPIVKPTSEITNNGWRFVSGKRVWKSDWTNFNTSKKFAPSGFRYNSDTLQKDNMNIRNVKPPSNHKIVKKKENMKKVPNKNDINQIDIKHLEELVRNILIKDNVVQNNASSNSYHDNGHKRAKYFQRNDPLRTAVVRKHSNLNNDADEQDNFMETIPNSVHNQIAKYNTNYKKFLHGGTFPEVNSSLRDDSTRVFNRPHFPPQMNRNMNNCIFN
jgi:hypothetical protein